MTVHAVVDPVQVEVPEDLAQDIRNPVDPGTRWVAIDLEYFNHSDEVVDKTLAYAVELRTDDGREAVGVVPSFTVPDMPEVPKTIPSNGSARGWVVYEVPDGAEPATLLLYGKLGEEPAEVEL